MTRLRCLFRGHDWARLDNIYPLHGYEDVPYADSFCKHCGKTGAEYLGVK